MVIKNILQIPKKFASHPLGRGMIAYGITFPTGCLIHQYYDKKELGKNIFSFFFQFPLFPCVNTHAYHVPFVLLHREHKLEEMHAILIVWRICHRTNVIRLGENCE